MGIQILGIKCPNARHSNSFQFFVVIKSNLRSILKPLFDQSPTVRVEWWIADWWTAGKGKLKWIVVSNGKSNVFIHSQSHREKNNLLTLFCSMLLSSVHTFPNDQRTPQTGTVPVSFTDKSTTGRQRKRWCWSIVLRGRCRVNMRFRRRKMVDRGQFLSSMHEKKFAN